MSEKAAPPLFVVDLGLWAYQTPREKELLFKQIQLMLPEIQDRGVVFASVPGEARPHLQDLGFKGTVLPGKFKGPDLVVLDPNAPDLLQLPPDPPPPTYVLGGIVDKGRRLKTSSLWYEAPRQKITFKGSAVGVPDRLNLIVDIILQAMEGIPLDRAVLAHMPTRDKRTRARVELDRGTPPGRVAEMLQLPLSQVEKLIQP